MDNEKFECYYKCIRCLYETKYYSDMHRHLKRKKKCEWKDNSNIEINQKKTEFEIINESLIKRYKNLEDINKKYNELKEKNVMTNSKDKNIKCEYCFKLFSNKGNLNRHSNLCKTKQLINKQINNNTNTNLNKNKTLEEEKNKIDKTNNNLINIMENPTVTQNVTQNIIQNNNIYVNINIDKNSVENALRPFYDKFDTSHISDETQADLLFSALYEDTLKEVLKNELNLNFLIQDSDDNKSLIYFNDKEQLKRINNNEIYEVVWDKLRDFLIESLETMRKKKSKYDQEIFNYLNKKIMEKHSYLKSQNLTYVNGVKNVINRSSEEKRFNILNQFMKIDENLLENNI